MGRLVGIALVSLCALAGAEAHACLWDRDTLEMERRTFPAVADLIAGRFLRHSDALYEWRIEDRQERLAEAPDDLPAMDDLAVALDKLERHGEAIAVMQGALLLDPDRYETHANLGTFFVHAGELEEGLVHIERALEINPDAHFGRERYQLWLVEYAMQADRPLPLAGLEDHEVYPGVTRGFTQWVLERDDADDPMAVTSAIAGITGMMRFGNHRSPILLEALGDLMLAKKPGGISLQLAAQAYLSAAESVEDRAAADGYRALAEQALDMQAGVDLPMVEYDLHWERADGAARAAQIQRDELLWIADPSVDPEAAFHAKYLVQPKPDTAVASAGSQPTPIDWSWLYWIPAAGAVLVVVLGRSHALS